MRQVLFAVGLFGKSLHQIDAGIYEDLGCRRYGWLSSSTAPPNGLIFNSDSNIKRIGWFAFVKCPITYVSQSGEGTYEPSLVWICELFQPICAECLRIA